MPVRACESQGIDALGLTRQLPSEYHACIEIQREMQSTGAHLSCLSLFLGTQTLVDRRVRNGRSGSIRCPSGVRARVAVRWAVGRITMIRLTFEPANVSYPLDHHAVASATSTIGG
jgi:hypothetical protein